MKVTIFLETAVHKKDGKEGTTNEQCFVKQYVQHIEPNATIEIVGVGGKDNLVHFAQIMKQNTVEGGINLVIFDCDDQSIGGGLENRKKWIEDLRLDNDVKFDYFFFPNNNDEGTFEDLLLHIINKEHKCLIDCFNGYEMCINGHNRESMYETPNTKAKIYSYITSFKRSKTEKEKMKKGDWGFNDERYWNLDDEYLAPLKDFLLKNLCSETKVSPAP